MDVRAVVAENLRRLMQAAADRGDTVLSTQKGVAKAAGVGLGTVQRILVAETAPAIDTLQDVAQAFDLDAWQLMAGPLDVSHPPNRVATEEIGRLLDRMTRVERALRQQQPAPDNEQPPSASDPRHHRTRRTEGKTSK